MTSPYILNDNPPYYSCNKERLDASLEVHPWLHRFMKDGVNGEISTLIELEPGPMGQISILMKNSLIKKLRLPGVKWSGYENYRLDSCYTMACPYLDKSPMSGKPFNFTGKSKHAGTTPFIYQHIIKEITELGSVDLHKNWSKEIYVCKGTCTLHIYNRPVRFVVYMEELLNGHHTRYETNIVLKDQESGDLLSVSYFSLETDLLNLYGCGLVRKEAKTFEILVLKLLTPGSMRRAQNACNVIEEAYLCAKYNPEYKLCRDKLLKDMAEIERDL